LCISMPGLMLNRSIQAFLKPKKLMLKLCEIGAPDWITLNQNTHIETKLLMQRTSHHKGAGQMPKAQPRSGMADNQGIHARPISLN